MAATRRGFLIAMGLVAAYRPGHVPNLTFGRSQDDRLDAFFERVFQRRVARNPLLQAQLGIKADQDKWNDPGDARAVADAELSKRDLAELETFDRDALTPTARLNFRLFEYDTRQDLRAFRWRHRHYPVCQMRGPQRTIPHTLINNHPVETREDALAYIARLHGVKPYLETVVEGLAQQEAMGVKPPAFSYPLVIGNCENLLRGKPWDGPEDSAILADFRAKLATAGLAKQAELIAQAEAAMREGFGPGFRHLTGWLRAAEARGAHQSGVWALPGGDAYYAAMLEMHTTLPVDADEVHAIGLEEVARIHGELRALMPRIGFDGELPAFFEYLRSAPEFYYPNTDAGRAAYTAAVKSVLGKIEKHLPALTSHRPKADLAIKRVEPWLEKSAGTAGYFSPSADGSRPGIVYYNLRDMANLPKYGLSALAFHEGIPGHHLENAVTQELPGLPKFRLYGGYTAYSEGWGLYSEQLPKALGLYDDPLQDLGRLTSELMRAGRLVVDTGLHAKRWTREQTIAWLDANTAASHADNITATHRYIVTPGQATAYEMGKLTMMALRDRAENMLGERYSLRAFNDVILGGGSLPMPMLEESVEAWITNA